MIGRQADLDALIALNQEIAAMVRAGIPLELGLKSAAASQSSRFAHLAARLSDRLAKGDSLIDALKQEGPGISPTYTAVTEAGLASGRLPEVLEDLAHQAITLQDVRRRTRLAIIYPEIVCTLAYVLFVAFVLFVVPVWIETRTSMRLPPDWALNLLQTLHGSAIWWGPLIPAFVIAVLRGPWLLSRFTHTSPLDRGWQVPGVRTIRNSLRNAQFCRQLATLLDHDIPAPRAVTLAAGSTGEDRLVRAAESLAEDLTNGMSWEQGVAKRSDIPEFLREMMLSGARQNALSPVLLQAAETYQRKAERWVDRLRDTLPVVLVVGVCGLVVLLYGLSLFVPLQHFWNDLGAANPR